MDHGSFPCTPDMRERKLAVNAKFPALRLTWADMIEAGLSQFEAAPAPKRSYTTRRVYDDERQARRERVRAALAGHQATTQKPHTYTESELERLADMLRERIARNGEAA